MKLEFTPIGIFRCGQKHRFETPRQGVYARNSGIIVLNDDRRLHDACRDLEGVERIWILFCFHLNSNWKPIVHPPVAPDAKGIGVFATRAPYRPNPIGLSCVKLERVEKGILYVQNHDLLDETPVLDIKPYIPAADSFPGSAVGWLDRAVPEKPRIEWTEKAVAQVRWLTERGGPDLENFVEVQLTVNPFASERKRVRECSPGLFAIGCRTWRIMFRRRAGSLKIEEIRSGYDRKGLVPEADDPYGDKTLHREYLHAFPE